MARMLTEGQVAWMEKQRELQDRARKAGYETAGMSETDRQKYVFQKAHAEAMERRRLNVLANPGAEADTGFRHRVLRDEEMRTARAHQMDMLGKELATRENEAFEKRMGMAEQGKEAALANKEAAIRAAELQTASAEKIAGINTASAEKIAGINTASAERMSTARDKSAEAVAGINAEASVEAAGINARAQAAREYAENLKKQGMLDEKKAWEMAETRSRIIEQIKKERKFIKEEEAQKLADERMKYVLREARGKKRKFIEEE